MNKAIPLKKNVKRKIVLWTELYRNSKETHGFFIFVLFLQSSIWKR